MYVFFIVRTCALPVTMAIRHEHILSFVPVAPKPNTFSFCCLSAPLRHHQGPDFFSFSFLGRAAQAITKASRLGLACIICVEFLFSAASVWERPLRMAPAQRSGLGLGFFRVLFFSNKPKPFFFFLQGTWLNKNVPYARQDSRTWPKQIINSSSRLSTNISLRPRSLAACSDFWTCVSAECWIASSPISAVLSSLSLRKRRCRPPPPLPTVDCFIPVRW